MFYCENELIYQNTKHANYKMNKLTCYLHECKCTTLPAPLPATLRWKSSGDYIGIDFVARIMTAARHYAVRVGIACFEDYYSISTPITNPS